MTATSTARGYLSGHCGIGRHHACAGSYGAPGPEAACACTCHLEPEPEPEPVAVEAEDPTAAYPSASLDPAAEGIRQAALKHPGTPHEVTPEDWPVVAQVQQPDGRWRVTYAGDSLAAAVHQLLRTPPADRARLDYRRPA